MLGNWLIKDQGRVFEQYSDGFDPFEVSSSLFSEGAGPSEVFDVVVQFL